MRVRGGRYGLGVGRSLRLPAYGGGLSGPLNLSLLVGLEVSIRRSPICRRASSRGSLGLAAVGLFVTNLSLAGLGEALGAILPFDLALISRGRLRLFRPSLASLRRDGGLLAPDSLLILGSGQVAGGWPRRADGGSLGLAAIEAGLRHCRSFGANLGAARLFCSLLTLEGLLTLVAQGVADGLDRRREGWRARRIAI